MWHVGGNLATAFERCDLQSESWTLQFIRDAERSGQHSNVRRTAFILQLASGSPRNFAALVPKNKKDRRSFSYNQIYSFSNRYDPVANKVILLSIGYNSSVKLLSKAVNGKAINRPWKFASNFAWSVVAPRILCISSGNDARNTLALQFKVSPFDCHGQPLSNPNLSHGASLVLLDLSWVCLHV